MTDSEAKKLNELRVVDLKYELEKREIDTAGVKAVLLKKLHKALVDEGLDPDTHMFPVEVDGKGTPLKKKKGEEEEEEDTMKTEEKKDDEVEVKVEAKSAEEEKGDGKDEKEDAPKEETPSKEAAKDEDEKQEKTKEEAKEVIVKKEEIDEVKDVAEKETPSKDAKKVKAEDAEGDAKEDTQEEGGGEEKKQDEETEERDELEVLLEDKDMEDDMEGADHKEVDDDEAIELKDKSDVNGMDAEDSIHLTIGEDEEKLMAGEDDLVEKHKDASAERSGRGSKKQDTRKNDARSISPDNSTDDKGKKSNYRNLWVSGLAAITRAQDLKHIFSKLGKVVAAKVVTNAKTPGARCYGFVTMATAEDAQACIKGLNLTELHGRLISVEAVANKPVGSNAKKPDDKRKASLSPQREEKRRKRDDSEVQSKDGASDREDKKRGENADKESSKEDDAASKAEGESGKEPEGSERGGDGHTSDKGAKSGSPARRRRPPIRERLGERPVPNPAARRQNRERIQIRGTRTDVLSFAQIKEERERQRMREKERAQREEERRRREELDRQRLVERRQRDELVRLEREREKVRQERLRLEKEKAELLRLERERLEREKEDLKRQQAKLEEAKRAKRAAASRYIEEERKRPTVDAVRRYEPVGPPRSKEPRRESPPPPPSSRSRYEEGSRREDAVRSRREEPPPRPKESMRYVERAAAPSSSSSTFRSSREDRGDRERDRREREEPHRKSESSRMHREPRYEAPPPSKSDHRYGSESWAGSGSGGSKTFGSSSGSSSRPESSWMSQDRKSDLNPWARGQPSQSDRWPVSGGSSLVSSGSRSAMYGMNMALGGSMGLSGVMPSPFPPTDRYDAYKPMGGSMGRKY